MKLDFNFSAQAIDAFIKIGAITILVFWCFSILKPFLLLVIWGGIIATALYPIVIWTNKKLGLSKTKISAALALVGVILLVGMLTALSTGLYISGSELIAGLQDGTLSIPKPDGSIKEWPVIGEKTYTFASLASSNIESVIVKYSDEIKTFVSKGAAFVGSLGGGFIQFIVSTIIAGVFMAHAEQCEKAFISVANRLTGDHGKELTELSTSTIRSVVLGVIGVALIQSVMAGVGMLFVGVPAIGLWMLLVILVAIIQLPPILALLPVILYVFSVDTTTTAILFLVWCIVVSGSDAILKPVLLSRGSDIPMLVILLGALGGMAMSGIVGLFVGAVVLSLTYNLFTVWLNDSVEIESDEKSD